MQLSDEDVDFLIRKLLCYKGKHSVPTIAAIIEKPRWLLYEIIRRYDLGSFKVPSLKSRVIRELKKGRTDYDNIAQELSTVKVRVLKHKRELESGTANISTHERETRIVMEKKAYFSRWNSCFDSD